MLCSLPPFGFLSQGLREFFDLLLDVISAGLKFLEARPELGLFSAGTVLLRMELLLRGFQLAPQLRKLSFQFAAALGDFPRLLLGPFAAFGLLGQIFG